jgi:hypothetical protein
MIQRFNNRAHLGWVRTPPACYLCKPALKARQRRAFQERFWKALVKVGRFVQSNGY